MQDAIFAIIFFTIYIVCMFVTDKAIDRYVPALASSKILLLVIGFSIAFAGMFFLMVWGRAPRVLFIGSNTPTFNPLRIIWMFLSAVFLGISQGFITDAQHVNKLEKEASKPVV